MYCMNITYVLRNALINLTGYWIYKKKDLPIGIDLKEDLKNKFNISPTVIFDVGANYGQTALFYRQEFNKAKIYSFEPVKKSFEILKENLKQDKHIFCYNLACGEKNEDLEIYIHEGIHSACNSIKFNEIVGAKTNIKETIYTVTLDDFVNENKVLKIDLLKIDTEGFELEVLKGSKELLKSKKINSIICEVALSGINKRNTQLNDIIKFLDDYEYYFVGLYSTDIGMYKEGIAWSNALFIKK